MNDPLARLDARLAPALHRRREAALRRQAEPLYAYDGARGQSADGRALTVLCSNDYLALAADPRPARAMIACAQHGGVGSGSAHLMAGHRREHDELEAALAAFTGREAARLFSTGYMANLGVIGALLGRGAVVAEDRLNHASLLDAVRLAGARPLRYRHADTAHLQRRLAASGQLDMIVTDGVFSMDGDLAPLPQLASVAERQGACLVVDDAHGLGVIGADGQGATAATGCDPARVPVLIGTLGKAFGTFGAFVAGSRAVIEAVTQFARTYVYTTAPPAALAAASLAALTIAAAEPWRREHVCALARRFRRGAQSLGLSVAGSEASVTPIQPLLVGRSERALAWSRALEEVGFRVVAIRPPTVPAGTARLRVSWTAGHTESDVDAFLEAVERVAQRYPVEKEA